jgi:hypothetical protein
MDGAWLRGRRCEQWLGVSVQRYRPFNHGGSVADAAVPTQALAAVVWEVETAVCLECRRPHGCWFMLRCSDVWLDYKIARAADHQKVFNVIATDHNQVPPAVHRRGIEDRQPGLACSQATARAAH